MLYTVKPEQAYRQAAISCQSSPLTQRRAHRYAPPPATANLRQSSGTMAQGIQREGSSSDSQKNGLPSK